MTTHKVVSHEEWVEARRQHLAREKELTHLRDRLAEERRALPWEKVEKRYVFDGPKGEESLADLFEGRHQLVVYHFMFDPSWDEGCKSCSFWIDNLDGIRVHLEHRDVTFVAISRAPYATLEAYRKRMGWRVKWLSSFRNDFNRDYHVSFTQEEREGGRAYYNYATRVLPGARGPRHQRVLPRRRWRDLPHLLDLFTRPGHGERRLPRAGPGAEGTRRGGALVLDGVAAAARRLRPAAGRDREGAHEAAVTPMPARAACSVRVRRPPC